ncbi:hypothetical protein [uncultured Ruminococcus sp.]|uniref:hypothetical protein n=1 Tax=uncultured Ruminococcus sp. TaxID=165186 RepID=UPI0025F5071B|nr:hypothetical protein [uncultured Ruminococcus sp.]
MDEQNLDAKNVRFMLDSLQILLECGETEHAIALIDAFRQELGFSDTKSETKV